jgi:hypothetical protein
MEKIIWTDRVGNEVLNSQRVEECRTCKDRRNARWIGHMFSKNCVIKHFFIEGKIEGKKEVRQRRRTRSTQLLHGLKEKTGYCHLKV